MNTRYPALLIIAALVPPAAAGPEPAWKLLRPSNTGIPGDFCHIIHVDENDNPWIGGYIPFWEEGGLGHFDGTRWRTLSNVDCSEILSPRFNDIVRTADGIYWIGTDVGLLRFDPAQKPWCVTRLDTTNTPLQGDQIRELDVAPDGTIWIANGSIQTAGGGLGHYDPATGAWEFWDTSNGLPWWAGWDEVDYVTTIADPGGGYTVWFGSGPMGMTTYRDGLFIWYGSPTPPPLDPRPTGILGHNPPDEQGNLWMMTNRGLGRRAPDGSFLIVGFPADLDTEVSRVETISGGRALLGTYYADVFLWDGGWSYLGNWGSGNHTYTLVEDSQGAFWAGGIGGSSKYENGFWQRHRLTNSGMISYFISTLAFDPLGNVYMNGNAGPGVGGFDILHPDGTWTNANSATYGIGLPWPLPTDDVEDICVRANGNILLALAGIQGIVELDLATENYTYLTPQGFDFEIVTEDGLGRVWGGRYGSGVFMITAPHEYQTFTPDNSPLPPAEVVDIIPDPDNPGFVYIAAPFGVAHTNGVKWTTWAREEFGLFQDTIGHHVTDFDLAPDGTFWVGSGLGVNHYDPATGVNVRHDMSNADLPSNDVWNVEIAPNGDIWISTFDDVFPYPGGVSRFDGNAWTTWRAESSPLPHNQVWDLAARTVPGGYELWVGTASEAVAVLTIAAPECPGDFNRDGGANSQDFFDFLTAMFAGSANADINNDSLINSQDFFDFLTQFFAGC